MKKEVINHHEVLFYDSVKEFPLMRFHEHGRYVLIEAGLGSDANAAAYRMQKIIASYRGGKHKEVESELMRLYQCVQLTMRGENMNSRAFACMVHSIDGKRETSHSGPDLDRVIKTLSDYGLTYGLMSKLLGDLKKKLTWKSKRSFRVARTAVAKWSTILYLKVVKFPGSVKSKGKEINPKRSQN